MKVLFLVGSARAGSVNVALAAEIERQCAQAGLIPTRLDLRSLALPI